MSKPLDEIIKRRKGNTSSTTSTSFSTQKSQPEKKESNTYYYAVCAVILLVILAIVCICIWWFWWRVPAATEPTEDSSVLNEMKKCKEDTIQMKSVPPGTVGLEEFRKMNTQFSNATAMSGDDEF